VSKLPSPLPESLTPPPTPPTPTFATHHRLDQIEALKAENVALEGQLDSGKMTILVTGGTGLVGRGVQAVCARNPSATESWFFAGSKDGDLRDMAATKALFDRVKPTHVLHLAAFVGGLFRNLKFKVR
jgi:hypothetical protein